MSEKFNKFLAEGKFIFEGSLAGPKVVIMAGIHGNEPCGLNAFKEILGNGLELNQGTVIFLLGSKKAVENNVRAFECNLNRMFRPDNKLTDVELSSYEYGVSRRLMKEMNEADILLDIHSSSASNTKPFAICEPHSYQLASSLPVDVIVSGLDKLHPTGTDAYMNSLGKIGMCVECGYHNDPATTDVAISAIYSLLASLEMIKFEQSSVLHTKKYIDVKKIYKCKNEFRAARSFGDFEQLQRGELIGFDGGKEVRLDNDSFVLFVSNKQKPGGEAFVIGNI